MRQRRLDLGDALAVLTVEETGNLLEGQLVVITDFFAAAVAAINITGPLRIATGHSLLVRTAARDNCV